MNYQQQIQTNVGSKEVFQALTRQLEDWWGNIDEKLTRIGDEFSVYFGDDFWRFRVIELNPDKEITWLCIGGEPEWNKEWIGTSLYWKIRTIGNETELRFLHEGLTPDFHCYDVCAPTWDKYIVISLKNFLETGVGSPHAE